MAKVLFLCLKLTIPLYTFNDLGQVDSTNNYAMEAVKKGFVAPGTAWFSSCQTAGRGQRGKLWESEPGKNMALSLALQPGAAFDPRKFHFNAMLALACLEVLQEILPLEPFFIKWPNDIYWGDRKAGGILTENLIQGGVWRWAITGIGLNVNQEEFPGLEHRAISLKIISGKEFDPAAIALMFQEKIVSKLPAQSDKQELMDIFNRYLWKRGAWVKLNCHDQIFKVMVERVNEEGKLQVSQQDGSFRYFSHGEVEWLN